MKLDRQMGLFARLKEFYDSEELESFKRACVEKQYDIGNCLAHLDNLVIQHLRLMGHEPNWKMLKTWFRLIELSPSIANELRG